MIKFWTKHFGVIRSIKMNKPQKQVPIRFPNINKMNSNHLMWSLIGTSMTNSLKEEITKIQMLYSIMVLIPKNKEEKTIKLIDLKLSPKILQS